MNFKKLNAYYNSITKWLDYKVQSVEEDVVERGDEDVYRMKASIQLHTLGRILFLISLIRAYL